MTDDSVPPAAPHADAGADAAADAASARARIEPAAAARSTDLLPGLYLLGFIVLAAALYFIWTNPPPRSLAPEDATRVNGLNTQLAALQEEVGRLRQQGAGPTQQDFGRLQQQVAALAARPLPPPVALAPLESRLGTLEARQAATPEQVQQLSGQVIALARQMPEIDRLSQRLEATEATLRQLAAQLPALSARIDDAGRAATAAQADGQRQLAAVAATLQQLRSDQQQLRTDIQPLAAAQKDLAARIDALDAASKQTIAQVNAVAQKAQLATRLQGVATALAAGHRLGTLPGAPPALARFATEDPPTEAALRSSFDDAAAKAQAASAPQPGGSASFADRMLARAQQSVTVRQGDHVLVGDPIAGILAHARDQLDAGDLAGAVATLKPLPPPAAQAMQPWTDRAQSLLDARAALATMAAG